MTQLPARVALLPLVLLWFGLKAGHSSRIMVDFYSTSLEFPRLYCSELEQKGKMDRTVILDAYEHFQNCNYQPFLEQCQTYREEFQMGDWHFYELIALASEQVFQADNFQVLFQWFLLRKSHIDAQLFYRENDLFVYALSSEPEFGFYTIERNGQRYVNLTACRRKLDLQERQAYLPEFLVDPTAHQAFKFRIFKLPRLPDPPLISRELRFRHAGQTINLKVVLNQYHLDMMNAYPYYSQVQFFHWNMSPEAEASLLPQLRHHLKGRDRVEQVELLLSFVRTAFLYKDDRKEFGREKPMGPEQTLYYSYSDCEDRSALFFYLVRKLLGIPAIVLDFEEHVGVALELEEVQGDYYMHAGRRFVYCEATGPYDQLAIGEMWEYVRNQSARVLTAYLPEAATLPAPGDE